MRGSELHRWLFQRGVSLVEMSVVLVILGLLVAGIVAGSSLVRQAELRAITLEVQRHITDVKVFYDKYGYYPGDIPVASTFWLNATDCPAGLAPAGCNGDGDQKISDNLPPTNSENAEKYRAWQHLVFSGIMSGNFTGLKVSGTNDGGDSTNSPSASKEGGLYYLVYDTFYGFYVPPVNQMCFGSVTSDGEAPAGLIWSPRDAYQIDNKIDDGLPLKGKMLSNATAGDGNCIASAAYNLPFEGTACRSCFAFDIIGTGQ